MPKSALLVLDMQPDIAAFHQGGIEPVVATIKDLIAWARTQSIPIIYSRVAFRPYQTDLELVLRSLGSQTLIYTGMSTARVVESTVREAHNRDFQNIVVSDATTATSAELHEAALRSMGDWFAQIKTAAEVKAVVRNSS
jgi:nicotinamidase-related amidase